MIEINPYPGDLVKLGEGKTPGTTKENGLFDFHSVLVAEDTLSQNDKQSAGLNGEFVKENGNFENPKNSIDQSIISKEKILSEQKRNDPKARAYSAVDDNPIVSTQPKTDAFLKHIGFSTNSDNSNLNLQSVGGSEVTFSHIAGLEAQFLVQKNDLFAHSDSEASSIQRLIPFSSVSSGYLSYKLDFTTRPTLVYANATSDVPEVPSRSTQAADTVKLGVNQAVEKWIFSQHFATSSTSITAGSTTKSQQLIASEESVPQLSQVSQLISRRHYMMTPSGVGNAVWLRDYSLSESEKEQFTQRVLINSKQYNINKVVLNGLITWQNKEEA